MHDGQGLIEREVDYQKPWSNGSWEDILQTRYGNLYWLSTLLKGFATSRRLLDLDHSAAVEIADSQSLHYQYGMPLRRRWYYRNYEKLFEIILIKAASVHKALTMTNDLFVMLIVIPNLMATEVEAATEVHSVPQPLAPASAQNGSATAATNAL